MTKLTAFILLSFLLLAGCNTAPTDAGTGLSDRDRRIAELESELAQASAERDRLRAERSAFESRLQGLSDDLARTRSMNTELQSSLDVAKDQYQRQDQVWQERLDSTARSLSSSNPDLLFGNTAEGDLSITVPNEVLFQPGSEVIGDRGARALDEVQRILNTEFPSNRIEIAGHTDSDPINRTKNKFDSNMNLSLARANAVYSYLWKKGMQHPERFRATGYGEFKPKAENTSKENKGLNRRVEVIVFTK